MEQLYKLDSLTSPDDPRDYIAETIFPEDLSLPDVYDPRDKMLPVRDQGAQGSCVAESCACAKETQEFKNIGFDDYFSPQFIYNNRVNQEGEGMYPRDSMNILYKKGIVAEDDYPYKKIEKPENISADILEKAKNHKIKGYAYINTINVLKAAIYRNSACLITFPVYSQRPKFWKQNKTGEVQQGAHAVSVVGWNKEGFIIRNSWGSSFGDKGYVIYPYVEWGSHGELWTLIDDESSKPDPKYSKWYWRFWRGLKNVFINYTMMPILTIAEIMMLVSGIYNPYSYIVAIGIIGFIAYKIISDKLYLKKDK